MSERVLIQFTCRRRGHVFASVVRTDTGGHEVVIPSVAYTDVGPRPGTVRVKRVKVEDDPEQERGRLAGQRMPVESADAIWALTVLCPCAAPRLLMLSMVEVQLREWQKFNARSGLPRRIVLETVT